MVEARVGGLPGGGPWAAARCCDGSARVRRPHLRQSTTTPRPSGAGLWPLAGPRPAGLGARDMGLGLLGSGWGDAEANFASARL
jgi:hypothetical protein